MYSYLQNVNTNVSNAKRNIPKGTPLTNIVNSYDGEIMETLFAPMDSKVFFMHTDPLTYANTAVFKLI